MKSVSLLVEIEWHSDATEMLLVSFNSRDRAVHCSSFLLFTAY